MRTTIEINDVLFRRAKKRAAELGAPLRSVVEDALQAHLGGERRQKAYRLSWKTESGRLQPGVRLDDRDTLFDLMDGR